MSNATSRLLLILSALSLASAAVAAAPVAVATFQSLGISWDPPEGAAGVVCEVRYRVSGTGTWSLAQPLWFDAGASEYRGSIVHLAPDTTYDVELSLVGLGVDASFAATTRSDVFPVAQTIELSSLSSTPLLANQAGTPSGYVVYTGPAGAPAVIDVAGAFDNAVEVSASYVILRGLVVKGAAIHGIKILPGVNNVVIERSDISGWGRIDADGWGVDRDAAIYAEGSGTSRVTVQGNYIHHPRSDSNNWNENRPLYGSSHPRGPQALTFTNTDGEHVVRFNTIYSDADHYFNDILGGGSNFSTEGFPQRDSDIHGNVLKNAWDDGVEAEGGNRNVRIWANWIDQTLVKIAVAPTATGPVYVWRNVAGAARVDDAVPSDGTGRGAFLKTTSAAPAGGRVYVFHNTLLQPPAPPGGVDSLGVAVGLGHGGPMLNVVARNNILEVDKSWHQSINDRDLDPLGDYDFDLYNGVIVAVAGYEPSGISGSPIYSPAPSYQVVEDGTFTLSSSSPGYDAGTLLDNFNDTFQGSAPDIGAHEAGEPAMVFGVSGLFPLDQDGDGLIDVLEQALCTDPLDADSDDDGLSDGDENPNRNHTVDPGESDPCQANSVVVQVPALSGWARLVLGLLIIACWPWASYSLARGNSGIRG